MRMTQLFGLTNGARKYLEKNVKRIPCSPCPHCGKMTTNRMDVTPYEDARHYGMFDDGPILNQYMLKSGKIVKEVVQAAPWSSGPCIFLCLENERGKQFGKWPQKEIDSA